MNKKIFVQLIIKYLQRNPNEDEKNLRSFISYVENNPHCFQRIHKEGARHIASNVLLLSSDYKKLLCLWHKKIKAWTFPGGHCDGNADIHAVAHNELAEETGIINAKILDKVPFHIQRFDYDKKVYGYTKSIYAIFFVAFLPKNQQPKIMEPDKCGEMRWFLPREFKNLVYDDKYNVNKAILKKWKALISNLSGKKLG